MRSDNFVDSYIITIYVLVLSALHGVISDDAKLIFSQTQIY